MPPFWGTHNVNARADAALNDEQFNVLVRNQRWRQNARRRRYQLVVVMMVMMVMVRGKMTRVMMMMMVVGRMWQMWMFIVRRRSGCPRRTGGTDQGGMLKVNRGWRWYCLNRGQLGPGVGTGEPGTGRGRYTGNRQRLR